MSVEYSDVVEEFKSLLRDPGGLEGICPKCRSDEQEMEYGHVYYTVEMIQLKSECLIIRCKRCRFEFGAEKTADWTEDSIQRAENP